MSEMTHSPHSPLSPRWAKIEEKIQETRDTFSLRMRMADGENINFLPGQFNMLGIPGFGEAAISFSSLAMENGSFSHTVKVVGNVTEAICGFESGDAVQVRGPFGNGWPLEKAAGKHVIVVAGGIGMAPLRPAIHHLLKHRDRFKDLFLLYGSRNEEDILYPQELSRWLESKSIHVRLSVDDEPKKKALPLTQGVMTTLMDKVSLPKSEAIALVCGPEIMIRFAAWQLITRGHLPGDIFVSLERRMKCGFGHCGHCQIGAKYVCRDGPVFACDEVQRFADAWF